MRTPSSAIVSPLTAPCRRLASVWCVLFMSALLLTGFQVRGVAAPSGDGIVPGRLVIKFENDAGLLHRSHKDAAVMGFAPEAVLNRLPRSGNGQASGTSQDAATLRSRAMDMVRLELQAFGGSELLLAMPESSHRRLQDEMQARDRSQHGDVRNRSVGGASVNGRTGGTTADERSGLGSSLPDDLTRTYFVTIDPGVDPVMVARKLSRIPGVAYAEPRVVHEIALETGQELVFLPQRMSAPIPSQSVNELATAAIPPNDPRFGDPGQNYFNYLRIPQAWEVTTSSSDIVIAIVDSGVDYTHPDLAPNLWRNPEPGRARELFPTIFATVENDTIGWNFWDSGPIFNPVQNADPRGTAQSHGTHVAGIAAAATNNGIGIAAAGYHSQFMAVRAGGTSEEPRSIGFGYEGILYAAVNGAHIINASFGSTFNSQFGRDVVDFVTSMGSLVVAAAGNTRQFDLFFPASYDNALAVASIELNTGQRSNFTTFNYGIDVSVTGRSILGTVFNESYTLNTGTSMAAPIVAGVAALLRHAHPDWSAQRLHGQLRSTANPVIYTANPDVPNQLGIGLLDAGRALTEPMPSVRLAAASFESAGGGRLLLNEEGFIRLTVANNGVGMNALTYTVETVSGDGIPGTTGGALGQVATGDTLSFDIPLLLPATIDPRENPAFLIHLEDAGTGYRDYLYVEYQNLFVDTHDANFVRMSFSSNGGIGYGVGGDERTGVGFVPIIQEEGSLIQLPNVLYESGLMIKYSVEGDTFFVDNVREKDVAPLNFRPLEPFLLGQDDTGTAQLGRALFDASFNETAPELSVTMHTFAMQQPGPDQGILVYFTLQNIDPLQRTYTDLFVGTYTDWDVGNFARNNVRFSASDSVLFAYNVDQQNLFVATAHLNNVASALAIDNAWTGPVDSLNFGVYYGGGTDVGFAEEYKRWSMVAGTEMTSRDTTDISLVTASGPFTLAPLEKVTVGFAYLFGRDKDDLLSQVTLARGQHPFPTDVQPGQPEFIPERIALVGNFPNPFNPSTRILVDLDRPADVTLEVYDMLGRRVATLFEGELDRRQHEFVFDGSRLSSGIYLVVMQAAGERQTLKMTMIK
ncbi:MAG: S8 family serine peptidase [Bacteroidetes bacterium]|nr:S8 family serine peptidase [Bacteroidota bacterium]